MVLNSFWIGLEEEWKQRGFFSPYVNLKICARWGWDLKTSPIEI